MLNVYLLGVFIIFLKDVAETTNETSNVCYCRVRYVEKGNYVDILEIPKFNNEVCSKSKAMDCKIICSNKFDALGKGDLSYFVFKREKSIGQIFCDALAEKEIMKVERKTLEVFSQVCEGTLESINRKTQEQGFCCILGKYFNCRSTLKRRLN